MLTHVPCGLKMDDKTCIDKTNDQLSCFSPVPNCLAVCSAAVQLGWIAMQLCLHPGTICCDDCRRPSAVVISVMVMAGTPGPARIMSIVYSVINRAAHD